MSQYWIGGTNTAFATNGNWSSGTAPTGSGSCSQDDRAQTYIAGSDQSSLTLTGITLYAGRTYGVGTYSAGVCTALQIGCTTLTVGEPAVSKTGGPAFDYFNFGSVANTTVVKDTRSSGQAGLEPLLLIGTSSSNQLLVYGGTVGFGTAVPGQTGTLSSLKVNGAAAKVRVGSGVTLTDVQCERGSVELLCGASTVDVETGMLRTSGSGTYTTLTIGGTAELGSTGTITNLYAVGDAVVTIRRAVTITNAFIYGSKARIIDPDNLATFTNGVDVRYGATSSQVQCGTERTITIGSL